MKRLLVSVLLLVALVLVVGGCRTEAPVEEHMGALDALPVVAYLPMVGQAPYAPMHGSGATYHECDKLHLMGIEWYYDWSLNPPVCDHVEAVPMVWSGGNAGKPIGGNSPWVLSFNEPDLQGQANMTPQQAVAPWATMVTAYPGKKLVSPAVIKLEWLREWLPLVTRKPDALAVHCYGFENSTASVVKCDALLTDAQILAAQYNIGEVWLTEFALATCWNGEADSARFISRMLTEVLPSHPMVTRYAWFQLSYYGDEPWWGRPDCNTSLVDMNTGQKTLLGRAYSFPDLNRNGCVEIGDLVIVASQFGQCQ